MLKLKRDECKLNILKIITASDQNFIELEHHFRTSFKVFTKGIDFEVTSSDIVLNKNGIQYVSLSIVNLSVKKKVWHQCTSYLITCVTL